MMGMLIGSQANAQGHIELGRTQPVQQSANVTEDGFTANFSFSSIESVEMNTEKGVFSNIMINILQTGSVMTSWI